MTLYLFTFNNYYNRIVKRYNTIDEYVANYNPLAVIQNINFNPDNGLATEQILNYSGNMPDYIIVVNEDETINSRWFVIESSRTRSQQFRMQLYRDVIADWYNDIVESPFFVEKAMLNIGDTAIFNNESMSYNQIKTSERLIKDASNCPWIVGYLAKDAQFENNISFTLDETVSAEYTTLDDYPYYKYNSENPLYLSETISNQNFIFNYYTELLGSVQDVMEIGINTEGQNIKPKNTTTALNNVNGMYHSKNGTKKGYRLTANVPEVYQKIVNKTEELAKNVNWSQYNYKQANFNNILSTSRDDLFKENNKIIKVGSTYYQISIITSSPETIYGEIPTTSALGIRMNAISTAAGVVNNPASPVYDMELYITPFYFVFNVVSISDFNVTIPSAAARTSCIDAPYDIFAIPYEDMWISEGTSVSTTKLTSKEVGMKLAREIQLAAGASSSASTNLYDIQLLPFCPLSDDRFDIVATGNNIVHPRVKLAGMKLADYTVCTGSDDSWRSIIFWIKSSNFTKYNKSKISVSNDPLEFKVQNETDMYRLCSPNWNGTFEFSATKNNGVNGFRIDCTYKPVNPYIRIAPIFNGLYGNINDDARGLICGGDFSLSQIDDSWISYKRQNANFQEIFDRQIQNMEVNNSIQRQLEAWNIGTGTISGAVTGYLTGSMLGGVKGGLLGGAVAGGASFAGGLADRMLNESLRSEAVDYTKDQFGYQLGNIKALPQSLTKVSSFNPNNKIFPILEYYTCSDIEKQALRNKIKYNGMTVERIGTINEFIKLEKTYIKGKLIRIENFDDDFHILNAISNELYKGVFI